MCANNDEKSHKFSINSNWEFQSKKYYQMDQQHQENKSDDDKNKEESENRPSCCSLDRCSSSHSKSQNQNKRSMIQVMSLDGNQMRQDIYQYYLMDNQIKKTKRNSNNSRISNSSNSMEPEPLAKERLSGSSRVHAHECQCDYTNCLEYLCPCYTEQNQICLLSSCCPSCIKMKNNYMQSNNPVMEQKIRNKENGHSLKCLCRKNNNKQNQGKTKCDCGFQNLKIIRNEKAQNIKTKFPEAHKNHKSNTFGCSCKKSHCLKKYCCCLAANKQCTSECQCQQCHNHFEEGDDQEDKLYQKQRYGRVDSQQVQQQIDIEQYLQQKNYDNLRMPNSMQFEYPDLKNSYIS